MLKIVGVGGAMMSLKAAATPAHLTFVPPTNVNALVPAERLITYSI
jgi:hypothetical protein